MSFQSVFFLGAGCSANFGYPLTNQLLPNALSRAVAQTKPTRPKQANGKPAPKPTARPKPKLQPLFSGIRSAKHELTEATQFLSGLKSLLPGLDDLLKTEDPERTKSCLAITDVLSLIDYALLSEQPISEHLSVKDLADLRRRVERAIFEVLYETGYYSTTQTDMLERFISRISAEGHRKRVAVITTNYDLAVDDPLFERYEGKNKEERIAEEFDLGMNWRSPYEDVIYVRPKDPRWALYKLHGSFNWLRCPICQHLYVNVDGSIVFQAYRDVLDDDNRCHCGYGPLQTHLVAPSLIRDIRDPNLLDIWKHSQEVLRRADKWYIIGYSFPAEDVAIRSMFLRALKWRDKPPQVTIIQRSNDARDRYKLFFPDCNYVTEGWEPFLDHDV